MLACTTDNENNLFFIGITSLCMNLLTVNLDTLRPEEMIVQSFLFIREF